MARRETYSNLNKTGQYRPEHVDGQTLYKVFQCLNPDCTEMIVVKADDIDDDFDITCPGCGYEFFANGEQCLFDYSMDVNDENGSPISVESGEFVISHDEYIEKAPLYKYCLICNTLKPLDAFHKHKGCSSGRQGECSLCKTKYNAIKNGTRISDQHFESAQHRRLLINVAGNSRINRKSIEQKFDYKCFNCGADLRNVKTNKEKPIDHTLPVYYLWPASNDSSTLLCWKCNENKTGRWPSEFYSDKKLHELSIVTGIDYHVLAGAPQYNPEALDRLQKTEYVDDLLIKYARDMNVICKFRNRILKDTGIDFFKYASSISATWVSAADAILK